MAAGSENQQQLLPEISSQQQYLSANRLSPSLAATNPSLATARNSTVTTNRALQQRCVSPAGLRGRSPSPLRKSLELMRVSRHEWDYRDQLISSLRAENQEMKIKVRDSTDTTDCYQRLLTSCQSLLRALDNETPPTEQFTVDTLISQMSSKVMTLLSEHKQSIKEAITTQDELGKLRGDIAACNVKLDSYKSQLEQSKSALLTKESELLQLKSDTELSQQNSARTSSMLQSLKRQLTETEEGYSKEKLTHTQNELLMGQLRKQIKEKETQIELLNEQLKSCQTERDEFEERAAVADSAYEEICFQFAESLKVDDECDVDGMILKVNGLVKENEEMTHRLTSLTHSVQLAELDAKANRETIMKLVSDVKKHKDEVTRLSPLQKSFEELTEKLTTSEQEKKSLLERLKHSNETVNSLKQELANHETNSAELKSKIESIQNSHKAERDSQQQYVDLIDSLSSLLGCQFSNETAVKEKILESLKCIPSLRAQLSEQVKLVKELRDQIETKESEIRESDETLKLEKGKTLEIASQLRNIEILERQISQQEEKYKSFIKRCSTALKLDSATSSIITGDFAEDTILLKAEQLAQLETQALAERQSAMYSLQRKLKSCRQQLESKELHNGLLQRKVTALETQVTSAAEKETEWQNTLDRGKKMTDHLDKLQSKLSQQKELISLLKQDKEELTALKAHSSEQSNRIERLEKELESLQDTRVHLSQQLADTRQRLHTATSADKERAEKCEENLQTALEELKAVKEREIKLVQFQSTVHQLVDNPCSDDELIKELQSLSMSCQKYRNMCRDLQASLRTLESGFRTSYQDTLTLLKSEI